MGESDTGDARRGGECQIVLIYFGVYFCVLLLVRYYSTTIIVENGVRVRHEKKTVYHETGQN